MLLNDSVFNVGMTTRNLIYIQKLKEVHMYIK